MIRAQKMVIRAQIQFSADQYSRPLCADRRCRSWALSARIAAKCRTVALPAACFPGAPPLGDLSINSGIIASMARQVEEILARMRRDQQSVRFRDLCRVCDERLERGDAA